MSEPTREQQLVAALGAALKSEPGWATDAEALLKRLAAEPDPLAGLDLEELGNVAALGVVHELRTQAEDQPDTRPGARWAAELHRSAATVERVYGLEDE